MNMFFRSEDIIHDNTSQMKVRMNEMKNKTQKPAIKTVPKSF